jgi:hypothetical protein
MKTMAGMKVTAGTRMMAGMLVFAHPGRLCYLGEPASNVRWMFCRIAGRPSAFATRRRRFRNPRGRHPASKYP